MGRDEYEGDSSNWYTYFSLSNMYFLCARIIYGENTYYLSDDLAYLNDYLKMNRQAEAWIIVNRILEDRLRLENNQPVRFSTSGTTNPTVYTVLTKFGTDGIPEFGAINNQAKGRMDSSNIAYQEALWLACCIHIGQNFDEWNRLIPRCSTTTYQCYNKGNLHTKTPNADWKIAYIPGWNTDYDYQTDFSAFPEGSDKLEYFNLIHALHSDGTLRIQTVYY